MGGVNSIKDKILEDARIDAERIIQEAEEKALALKGEKGQQADILKKRFIEENNEKAKERNRRMLAVAQLEMRKGILAVKQEMIDKVLIETLKAIEAMPAEQYRQIIADMLEDSVVTGAEQVIFSNKDQKRLDEEFLAEVNNRLKLKGKKGNLKLVPERGSFNSGFVLIAGGIEINNSFESIIRMSRDRLESEIAQILFGEEG